MSTTTQTRTIAQVKSTNFKSKGGKLSVAEEFPVSDLTSRLSKVFRNSNGTPFVWLDAGNPEGSDMVYMSSKAATLCEQLHDQLSKSKHAVQVWINETTNEEFYVIGLVGETISSAEAEFAD